MEFTSFDDLKNLLGSEGLDKPNFMQRNIVGSSIKVKRAASSLNPNTQLVINKDTEALKYQAAKMAEEGGHGTYQAQQEQARTFFAGQTQKYDTELNTYMKNQRQSLKQFDRIEEFSEESSDRGGSYGKRPMFNDELARNMALLLG